MKQADQIDITHIGDREPRFRTISPTGEPREPNVQRDQPGLVVPNRLAGAYINEDGDAC